MTDTRIKAVEQEIPLRTQDENQDDGVSEEQRGFCWHSTAESVEKGKISLLAIVETILATSVAIYLSVKYDTYRWIAYSACVAPFLLLRTEYATEIGIRLLDKVGRYWIPVILFVGGVLPGLVTPQHTFDPLDHWQSLVLSHISMLLILFWLFRDGKSEYERFISSAMIVIPSFLGIITGHLVATLQNLLSQPLLKEIYSFPIGLTLLNPVFLLFYTVVTSVRFASVFVGVAKHPILSFSSIL